MKSKTFDLLEDVKDGESITNDSDLELLDISGTVSNCSSHVCLVGGSHSLTQYSDVTFISQSEVLPSAGCQVWILILKVKMLALHHWLQGLRKVLDTPLKKREGNKQLNMPLNFL